MLRSRWSRSDSCVRTTESAPRRADRTEHDAVVTSVFVLRRSRSTGAGSPGCQPGSADKAQLQRDTAPPQASRESAPRRSQPRGQSRFRETGHVSVLSKVGPFSCSWAIQAVFAENPGHVAGAAGSKARAPSAGMAVNSGLVSGTVAGPRVRGLCRPSPLRDGPGRMSTSATLRFSSIEAMQVRVVLMARVE
jgi:hypothetical protein